MSRQATREELAFIASVRRWHGTEPTSLPERYRTISYLNPFSETYDAQKWEDVKKLNKLIDEIYYP